MRVGGRVSQGSHNPYKVVSITTPATERRTNMDDKTYVRFIPTDEFVNEVADESVVSSVVGLLIVVRDGITGYLVPCLKAHPDAEVLEGYEK